MDKATHRAQIQRQNAKRAGVMLLYLVTGIVLFWWSYALVSTSDCSLSGVKLAVLMLPLCTLFGPIAAAAIPFGFGLWATWLLWRTLTSRSRGTCVKAARAPQLNR